MLLLPLPHGRLGKRTKVAGGIREVGVGRGVENSLDRRDARAGASKRNCGANGLRRKRKRRKQDGDDRSREESSTCYKPESELVM